jgi:hypothetical protein
MRIIKQSTEDERFANTNLWIPDDIAYILFKVFLSFQLHEWIVSYLTDNFSPAGFLFRGYAEKWVNNWFLVYLKTFCGISPNGIVVCEWWTWMWRDAVEIYVYLEHNSGICLDGLEKGMNNLSEQRNFSGALLSLLIFLVDNSRPGYCTLDITKT